jgi:hypothetical protein
VTCALLVFSAAHSKRIKQANPYRTASNHKEQTNIKLSSFRSLVLALVVWHLFIFIASPSPPSPLQQTKPSSPKRIKHKTIMEQPQITRNKQTKTLLILISQFGFDCLTLVYICHLSFTPPLHRNKPNLAHPNELNTQPFTEWPLKSHETKRTKTLLVSISVWLWMFGTCLYLLPLLLPLIHHNKPNPTHPKE